MSDERRKRAWWPWLIAALLLLYPLSFGPALRIYYVGVHDGWISNDDAGGYLSVFYNPLISAARIVGLEQALDRYTAWWIRDVLENW